MKVDGKTIAGGIFQTLQEEVILLKEKNITAHLVIILIGNDPASESYVRQKVLKGEGIGAKITLLRFPQTVTERKVLATIEQLNNDNTVHGIIVQRPIPKQLDGEKINQTTMPEKDIDAFRNDSPYAMPLAAAVLKILEYIYSSSEGANATESRSYHVNSSRLVITRSNNKVNRRFANWLRSKSIVVIGKGQTGGGPTINLLRKMDIPVTIIDSKTQNPQEMKKNADIIVSAVGKKQTIKPEDVKKGVILLSVGMHKGSDGKLHADYEEEEIASIASYYTPVPGGVGPVNVAMLLANLIEAAKN